jgi:HEAT repeat protein
MSYRICCYLALMIPSALYAYGDEAWRRIEYHLIIDDTITAEAEARRNVVLFPSDIEAYRLHLRTLAALHDDYALMSTWKKYHALFPMLREDFEIIEELSWSFLLSGATTSSSVAARYALIGAALTRDARALPLLHHSLHHSDAHIRYTALSVAPLLSGGTLFEEIYAMLPLEEVWYVRHEALRCLAALPHHMSQQKLHALLSSQRCSHEEQSIIIAALISDESLFSEEDLKTYLSHSEETMRILACEYCGYHNISSDLVVEALDDTSPRVRCAAIKALTISHQGYTYEETLQHALKASADNDETVSLLGARLLVILGAEEGEDVFLRRLSASRPLSRYHAAAVLASAGKNGIPLLTKLAEDYNDIYIRINAAFGLIGYDESRDLALEAIALFLQDTSTPTSWYSPPSSFVSVITPYHSHPSSPPPPSSMAYATRLDIINALALFGHEKATALLCDVIEKAPWAVLSEAIALTIREGEAPLRENTKKYLTSTAPLEARVHAACAIALLCQDTTILPFLYASYPSVSQETQIAILEVLGRLGNKEALPFLAEAMLSPFRSMRSVAASAFITCKQH